MVLFFINGGDTMSLINISNLTFSYDGSYDNIFENVSFQIDTNWKLGFTGRNGRGKTTFLKLLLGEYEYKGIITYSEDFEYFPYEVEHTEYLTIDIIREIAANAEDWEITKELSMLDVNDEVLYRQFFTLSCGEQTKILLTALFLKQNAFLLIDEPTNYLDSDGRKKLAQYLKTKNGYILISHDRIFLDSCIDHILAINKTNIEVQKGNFSSWFKNKELQDSFEYSKNESLKREINRLSESSRQSSAWSDSSEKSKYHSKNSGLKVDRGFIGHKSAKMMKRSKTIEKRKSDAINEKSMLLKNIESNERLGISPLKFYTDRLLEIKNVSVFYDDKCILENISFNIEQGDRILLKGKNGCGKSSIIKLICGLNENIGYSGEIIKNDRLIISYVNQNTDFLCGKLSEFAHSNSIDESLFKTILRKMDFSREQFEKDIRDFSEGQKKKVLIAKSLCEKAHLYIWDEPLNFIDVISRMQIEKLLLEYKPTILFVEHDIAFSENVATKTIMLSKADSACNC